MANLGFFWRIEVKKLFWWAWLKVSKFQNEFMKSFFLPKNEPKIVRISALLCGTVQGKNPDIWFIFWEKKWLYEFILKGLVQFWPSFYTSWDKVEQTLYRPLEPPCCLKEVAKKSLSRYLLPFRTFRPTLFPKPVSWLRLFLPLLTANRL